MPSDEFDERHAAAALVLAEVQRQVEQQVASANAVDTKALTLAGVLVAVAGIIAPAVVLDTCVRTAASASTFLAIGGGITSMALAMQPGIGRFSYGPDPSALVGLLDAHPIALERAMADSMRDVRDRNELFMQGRAKWLSIGVFCLVGAVLGLAAMVTVGAVK